MSRVSIGDFEFEVHTNHTATIVKYTRFDNEHIIVPHGVNGCDVVNIGKSVFVRHPELKTVTIPDTINIIKENAFYGCANLERVIILSDTLFLHDKAFAYCKKLKQIVGEGEMILAGEGVFEGCGKLWELRYCFSNQTIPARSFYGCKRLEKLTFLHNVTFEKEVFFGCVSVKELWFGGDAYADRDTTRFIKKREIHCNQNSNLVDLAYDGANIIFLGGKVWL
jgi:hypothetical protein